MACCGRVLAACFLTAASSQVVLRVFVVWLVHQARGVANHHPSPCPALQLHVKHRITFVYHLLKHPPSPLCPHSPSTCRSHRAAAVCGSPPDPRG
jgi:hypothetical protein